MPWYRCGGASLASVARSEVGNRLRSYCGDNFTLSATWREMISGDIDGISNSTTSIIQVTSYEGFDKLNSFFTSLHAAFKSINSYLETLSSSDHNSPYYNRWCTFWRHTSAESNGPHAPYPDVDGYNGTASLNVFGLSVPDYVSNLYGFDKKMFEALKNIVGVGDSNYKMDIHNSKSRQSIYYTCPQYLIDLFKMAGYTVTLPDNKDNAVTDNTYREFSTRTSAFIKAVQ